MTPFKVPGSKFKVCASRILSLEGSLIPGRQILHFVQDRLLNVEPLSAALTQCRRRLDIELKAAPILVNDDTVIPLCRFERYITGPHIGKDALSRTFKRSPESAAAGGLDGKAIAFVNLGRFNLARRESFDSTIVAPNRYAVS